VKKPNKQPSYSQLRKIWYGKLKKEGFDDIETTQGYLKDYSSRVMRKNDHENLLDSWPSKIAYYDMCTTFLNEHKFEAKLDQVIWEYHTNGISNRNIAKLLKKVKIYTNYESIRLIVKRLQTIMKQRYLK